MAFPTETVYGLGARADRAEAAARIFAAKQRPSFDPLIVHLPDLVQAREWGVFDERAERLAAAFWPGPLTLVLPRVWRDGAPRIPDLVTSGLDTVGLRVPDQPMALAMLRGAGLPVAAPSANPFGYVSPTTARHVRDGLGDAVDLVLDGGPCAVGVESTIVDLSSGRPRLLRPGGLPREAIEAVLGQELSWEGFVPPVKTEAPGMLESHYAPRVPLEAFETAEALIARARALDGACVVLSATRLNLPCLDNRVLGEGAAMAVGLFAALRDIDARQAPRILALLPSEKGLGLAVRDRLFRASRSRIADVPPR